MLKMLNMNKVIRSNWLKKSLVCGTALLMLATGVNPVTAEVMHNIRKGESLYKIAVNNGTTVKELKQANGIQGDLIYAGDKLELPEELQAGAKHQPVVNHRHVFNQRELDLLARLITAEASGEPFSGQVAVAAVILNRMNDARFPATLAENVFKRHEFESVSNGLIWRRSPSNEAYRAAEAACKGWDPTYGSKYFFNPAKVHGKSWVWTRRIVERIGNHVFGV